MQQRARGRPRAFDPEQVMAQILEVFWARGFEVTSLDELTAATGIARPSLFSAFGNKEAMYLKALARYSAQRVEAFQALFSARLPISEALERYYLEMIELYYSGGGAPRGCPYLCTAAVVAPYHEAIQASLAQVLSLMLTSFSLLFQRARSRGELCAAADTEKLARLAAAALKSIAIESRAGVPRGTLEGFARDTIRLLVGSAQP